MEPKERMDLINTLKLEIMDKHELRRLIGCSECKHTTINTDGIGVCEILTEELQTILAKKGIISNIKVEVGPEWVCKKWEGHD